MRRLIFTRWQIHPWIIKLKIYEHFRLDLYLKIKVLRITIVVNYFYIVVKVIWIIIDYLVARKI